MSSRNQKASPEATDVNITKYGDAVVGEGNPMDTQFSEPIAAAVSVASGADSTQGAIADAVVAAGATGTVSAKLRRLTTDIDALLTELKLKADLTEVQPVKIDQTTPGTTDSVSVSVAQGAGATIGAVADAAVVTDAGGTLSAKLRGLIKLLVDKITVKLDAGTSYVGKVRLTDGTADERLPTTSVATNGASALTVIAAVAASKHRIFRLTISADTAGTVTISDGFGAVYLPALAHMTIDFGRLGRLQTTANTNITITNSGAGNVSAHGTYSTEAA